MSHREGCFSIATPPYVHVYRIPQGGVSMYAAYLTGRGGAMMYLDATVCIYGASSVYQDIHGVIQGLNGVSHRLRYQEKPGE
jgi:hypothetical protein